MILKDGKDGCWLFGGVGLLFGFFWPLVRPGHPPLAFGFAPPSLTPEAKGTCVVVGEWFWVGFGGRV